MYREKALADDKPVDYYNIRRGARVNMLAHKAEKLDLFVKWSKTVRFQADIWDSIGTLKQAIKSQGISVGRGLRFEGNLLQDDRCIVSYGIPNNYTFQLTLGTIEITARTVTGRELTLRVEDTDRIAAVKERVAEWKGCSQGEIRVIYAGKELENDCVVADHSVAPGAVVHLIGAIRIFVKTLAGKNITIDCDNTNTIGAIKAEIEQKEGIPAHQQLLLFTGKPLEDDHTLADCRIKHESVLILALKPHKEREVSYTIVLRDKYGETSQLSVKSSDTVEDMRKRVEFRGSDQEAGEPFLVLGGEMMQDGWTLGGYHAAEGVVIDLL